MASARASGLRLFLHKWTPFLFKRCPGGNYHWFWDRYCYCCVNEHWDGWNGGVYDFKTKKEAKCAL